MKKIKYIGVLLLVMWTHLTFAYQNPSDMPSFKSYRAGISIVNNSYDDYTVNYQLQSNTMGSDWVSFYLRAKSEQPFFYSNPPYDGIWFNIVRNKDSKVFFYGTQSKGSIVIPE